MADLLFWLFMLVSMLLIPACMLYFGRCCLQRAVLGTVRQARAGGLAGLDAPTFRAEH